MTGTRIVRVEGKSNTYSAYLRRQRGLGISEEEELVLIPDVDDIDEDKLEVVTEGMEHKDTGKYLYFT